MNSAGGGSFAAASGLPVSRRLLRLERIFGQPISPPTGQAERDLSTSTGAPTPTPAGEAPGAVPGANVNAAATPTPEGGKSNANQNEQPGVVVEPGDVITLQLDEGRAFAERCPDQYAALIECAAFVNWRRIEVGERSILALSFR